MHSKTLLTVFALATAVAAIPVPNDIWGSSPSTESLSDILGSPFGNGNSDGSSNSAGNDNQGNGDSNGNGDGDKNGNSNVFGNDNGILSGNSGLKIGRNDPSSSSSDLGTTLSNIFGSPFGNGDGDGSGNSAGNGNKDNGDGNGNSDGDGNGNGNKFGNGNDILSGNSGLSIGKKVRRSETLGTYVGTIIDDVTVPLEPSSSSTIWTSPSGNENNDGSGNTAGSGNSGNGNDNGSNDGNNNGNDSGIPDDALDLIPDQTVTSLNQDFGQLASDGPTDVVGVLAGALSGDDTSNKYNGKRQVLTGVEDIIAQDIAGFIPRE
ncbi:hypothetical protein N431DRAFT_443757 [Stipitochalara longipes BDJ]|nr:hypothetical protein N431DRAFT_443757 [Stipitochalara longipes BDJ]